MTQISLTYVDNFNNKYLKKSEKSEATQIQLADFTKNLAKIIVFRQKAFIP